uniref:Putative secreted protein n=1 Tax=Psorophora albipes TaxID=869069 RepID=T1E2P9_9DIPT
MKLLLVTIGILAVAFAFPNHRNDDPAEASSPPSDNGQSRNETDSDSNDGGAVKQQHLFNLTLPDGQQVSILFDPSGPIEPRPFLKWRDVFKYVGPVLGIVSRFG